ncbi:MAG TPA: radical SAM protein [Anaerolineae bacterium]|nr:radical SAM protein [Anaerolineae bacterium]
MFEKIEVLFEKFFSSIKPAPAGIYHYQAPPDAELPYRLHLRIEPDGNGLLIVNASTVLHLNRTAAEYAYHLLQNTPEKKSAELMADKYEVSKEKALQDYRSFVERIETLVHTPDLDPVTFLDFDRVQPYIQKISAPYRLDCALTYQVSQKARKDAAPLERVDRELNAEEWKKILEKAWHAGIPHVVFTGGEPTLRKDLIALITYAEKLGLVTGLLTDGISLGKKKYLQDLLLSGLDHVMMLCDQGSKNFWQSLKAVLAEDIATTVHVTLMPDNKDKIESLLEKLAKLGVTSLSLSVSDLALQDWLKDVQQMAVDNGLSLVWDLPVPYSNYNPVSLELEVGGGRLAKGAGKAWLYIEPDGDVLPAQGINKVLGNMLRDPWERIWKRH